MERRPLLLAGACLLALLAALPATLRSGPAAEASVGRVAVLPASVVTAQPGPQPPTGLPGTTTTVPTSKSYDGQVRRVVIHVPDGLLAPAPLVVALHGHAQGTDAVRTYTALERLSDEQGFVVAFPEGAGGSWNAGTCCFPGSTERVDDVAFLDEVLSIVRARVLVDPDRISFTGGSNGAMMALRYACERPSVVASVAAVAGVFLATCTPSEPVPVLLLHGAQDRAVPLAGGPNKALRTAFPPVDRSLAPFRKAGGPVSLLVVPGVGHEWMTRERHGIDATRTVWNWMRDHPRPL